MLTAMPLLSLAVTLCRVCEGSAQRYVKFLLASTAGYKEPMLHQDGCMDTCSTVSQQSRRQASHAS